MARMKKDVSKPGRGDELTEWATPDWCTFGLVDHWPELVTWSHTQPILEPQAGSGAIVRALLERGCVVEAIEICEDRCAQIRQLRTTEGMCSMRVTCADFLQRELFGERSWFATVGNPPFTPAWAMLRHVRRALEVTRGFLAQLLPLSFMSGGSGRAEFWESAPPLTQLLFFDSRPAFVDDGGLFEPAWFVWNLREGARPRSPAMIHEPVFKPQTFDW